MAILHAAFCIFQTLLGLGLRKDGSRDATDWLKLALAVAAQPEDEESKRLVNVALLANNQVFLDFLRAALDTRVAAATRLADIESDGIECRALLPGSPALWGWTTNLPAESAILKTGIEAAMCSSVFESPSASCSKTSDDVFIGLNSSEAMGGATLRDIYAKAWEFHREPLIWTPRGPGAGVGASTWTLTPASSALQGPQTRHRSVSDASESRSSIAGHSPCLYTQRSRIRRDSLHDVFASTDAKQKGPASPCPEAGMITPSPSLSVAPLPSASSEPPVSRRSRRSISCTRSHISSTTAATVSECSTTQDLQGLGLSFSGSTWSRPTTPSDSCFGDGEVGKEIASKGKRMASYRLLGGRGQAPSGAATHQSKTSGQTTFTDNSKPSKLCRPGLTPLQRMQASVPKRASQPQRLGRTTSVSKTQADTPTRSSHLSKVVNNTPGKPTMYSRDRATPLRRVQSVAAMVLTPPSQLPRGTTPKTPLIGPVPSSRRASIKQDTSNPLSRTIQESPLGNAHGKQPALLRQGSRQAFPSVSTPTIPQPTSATCRTTSMSQSRIPRPVSRAGSVSARSRTPSVPAISRSPTREPRQLLTPTSTVRVRERASFSQASRPALTGSVGRARSQTGQSTQERPALFKDIRLSRPPSRAHLAAGSSAVIRQRTRRSDSVTSVSTMVDRWEPVGENCDVQVAA